MPKRYFDEIEIGEQHESPGVTITDWHVLQFAGLSMDFFELHTNEAFARETQFSRRVAHGLLGLAITDGLKNRSDFQVHAIASLHWSWDFVGPIFIGDTVKAVVRVAGKKPSRTKPDRRRRFSRDRAQQPGWPGPPEGPEPAHGGTPAIVQRLREYEFPASIQGFLDLSRWKIRIVASFSRERSTFAGEVDDRRQRRG